jgi:four helix bundle protein
MPFKFEKLEVWGMALAYVDQIYALAEKLPRSEDYNLKSQITRAATSIALNIAEGSTGQTDIEQARFLGMALRSLVETVACQHLISRRKILADTELLRQAYRQAEALSVKLQAFRKTIAPDQSWIRDEPATYSVETDGNSENATPF